MSNNSFAFIICTNNETYLSECVYYINHLNVPESMSVELYSISDAISMASRYNEGMNASDAKYKIYMHQDVFITNTNLLYDLLKIFNDKSIGMVGPAGCLAQISDGDFTKAGENFYANIYSYNSITLSKNIAGFNKEETATDNIQLVDVAMLDGMFLATQYDIPWDEENFTGWDYYDASQCTRFHKEGYRVVVAATNTPWALHDEGICNLSNFDKYREVFCDQYSDLGYKYVPCEYDRGAFYAKVKEDCELLVQNIPKMSAIEVLHSIENSIKENRYNSVIYNIYYLFLIYNAEIEACGHSIFYPAGDLSQSLEILTQIRFLIWRELLLNDIDAQKLLGNFTKEGLLSQAGLDKICELVCFRN